MNDTDIRPNIPHQFQTEAAKYLIKLGERHSESYRSNLSASPAATNTPNLISTPEFGRNYPSNSPAQVDSRTQLFVGNVSYNIHLAVAVFANSLALESTPQLPFRIRYISPCLRSPPARH